VSGALISVYQDTWKRAPRRLARSLLHRVRRSLVIAYAFVICYQLPDNLDFRTRVISSRVSVFT